MLKLETQTEKTAKSVNEAKELALSELGLTEAEAEIEIVEEGTKGFLGIGSKDAKVIARVKDIPSYRAKKFLEKIFADMNITVIIQNSAKNTIKIDVHRIFFGNEFVFFFKNFFSVCRQL